MVCPYSGVDGQLEVEETLEGYFRRYTTSQSSHGTSTPDYRIRPDATPFSRNLSGQSPSQKKLKERIAPFVLDSEMNPGSLDFRQL